MTLALAGVFVVDFRPSDRDGKDDWPRTLPHGHRLVVVFNVGRARVRVFEPFAVATATLPRRLFDRLRRRPASVNPQRLAARIDRRRRLLKRCGVPCADDTARAIVAALRRLPSPASSASRD